MTSSHHLHTTAGSNAGRDLCVPPGGARLGRSSRNDFVLDDPLLSRHHCRFFFKPGNGLWVADLASANQTLVNGHNVQEVRLNVGDVVTVGDTSMQVVSDQMAPAAVEVAMEPQDPVIDLGLSGNAGTAAAHHGKPIGRFPLIVVLSLVVALALAAWLPRFFKDASSGTAVPGPVVEPKSDLTLQIDYEKIEATPRNIFRYHLTITPERMISIRIDDIENGQHLGKEKAVSRADLEELATDVINMRFLSLSDNYVGIQPDVLDSWDMSITVGRRTHRCVVRNRLEPEIFQEVRERIEKFGQHELGLLPVHVSPAKLRKMAYDAYLHGKKMYDERNVRMMNLGEGIKSLDLAKWYLESVEPKPEYYADIRGLKRMCKESLVQKYDDLNFRAKRSIRLREWGVAAQELRTILELISDAADPRNEEARKELLDVERRQRDR